MKHLKHYDPEFKACKNKKTYETKKAAEFFAGVYNQNVYRCHYCGKFHITNLKQKEKK